MVYFMENPIKMDDLGVPLFSETSTLNWVGFHLRSTGAQMTSMASFTIWGVRCSEVASRTIRTKTGQCSCMRKRKDGNHRVQNLLEVKIRVSKKTHFGHIFCVKNNPVFGRSIL